MDDSKNKRIVEELQRNWNDFLKKCMSGKSTSKYRKMSGDEISRLSQFVREAIETGANYSQKALAKAQLQDAVNGTYLVTLDPSLHLADSRKTPGAFRALGFDASNNLVEHAELFLNDAEFDMSINPIDIINGAFNVASFVTGQYFLSQINEKMTVLEEKIENIQRMFDNKTRSEIMGGLDELKNVSENIECIENDTELRRLKLDCIGKRRSSAYDYISFYKIQICDELKLLIDNKKMNNKVIRESIERILNRLQCYNYAVLLLCVSDLLEARLKYDNLEYEKSLQKEMHDTINEYSNLLGKTKTTINDYINKCNTLNERSFKDKLVSGMVSAAFQVGVNNVIGNDEALPVYIDDDNNIVGIIQDNRRETKKQEIISFTQNAFISLDDVNAQKQCVSTLSGYIKLLEHPVEIIYYNGEYYTNLPKTVN